METKENVKPKTEEAGKVYKTNEYSKFVYVKGNRTPVINKLLDEDIKKTEGNLSPILVKINSNGLYDIIDGQHRFEICKRNLLPLYFIIPDRLFIHHIQRLNETSKKWKNHDYVSANATFLHVDANIQRQNTKLQDLHKASRLFRDKPLTTYCNLLMGGAITTKLRSGEFIISANMITNAKIIEDSLLMVKDTKKYKNGDFKFIVGARFLSKMHTVAKNERFTQAKFLRFLKEATKKELENLSSESVNHFIGRILA